MCDEVGRPRPDEKDADRIAAAAHRYVQRNVDVHAPEIVRRLRELKGRGLTLHLASGDHHEDLFGYLETMGIVELFDRLYGSDLVNTWKSSADYYRAILRDACVAPTTAVVIDDSERAIGWAAECGLRGVLVRRGAGEPFEAAVLRAFDSIEPL